MNTIQHTTPRRAGLASLLFAAGLAVVGAQAFAGSPSTADLGNCVAQAERYFGTDSAHLAVRDSDLFSTGSGRRVLVLNVNLESGGQALRPRIYCTLETDGRITRLHSVPRLPQRAAPMMVAK